ncbi:SDR family NAD(P)-dependent oxidoreductase [Rhodococcus koreensis]|uniref:SDR family NAD(P)-dependent oxidoreductase n=1 Tax=Rhodococcus koreensis TaxID=99653 RepID=UPI00367040D3
MNTELEGKRALVVGGGQTPGQTIGNGRATALLFAQEGAEVVVADRELDRAEDTANEIVKAGGKAWAVAADIADEAAVEKMVKFARDTLGGIDILHNNVGIGVAAGDAVVTEIDLNTFEKMTRVNLTGMVATCKHVIPHMREAGSGSIVCIGSLATVTGYPNIAYKTSKAGVVALVENIALRYGPNGIRCNAILPGYMDTPMAIEAHVNAGRARDEVYAQRESRVPLRGKQGTAWDTARAAVFLASENAHFITGVCLKVDGGQSLLVG